MKKPCYTNTFKITRKIFLNFLINNYTFSIYRYILYYNNRQIIKTVIYEEEQVMQMEQVKELKGQSLTQCPECGEKLFNSTESYLMECDRCLSKREE